MLEIFQLCIYMHVHVKVQCIIVKFDAFRKFSKINIAFFVEIFLHIIKHENDYFSVYSLGLPVVLNILGQVDEMCSQLN